MDALINVNQVLHRTERGDAALEQHSRTLPPKLRALLVLIDGRRTIGDILGPETSYRQQLLDQLADLIQRDLVESPGLSATEADSTASFLLPHGLSEIGEEAHAALSRIACDGARRQLEDRLARVLSMRPQPPAVEGLPLAQVQARTLSELALAAKQTQQVLSTLIGVELADKWWADAKVILTAWRKVSGV